MISIRIFVLFLVFLIANQANEMEESDEIIEFYSLETEEPFTPPTITTIYSAENISISSYINVRLPFIGQPCKCAELKCTCCAGMSIQQFNFNRKSKSNLSLRISLLSLHFLLSN